MSALDEDPGNCAPVEEGAIGIDRREPGGDHSARLRAADVSASKPDPESYVLSVRKLSAAFPGRAITPAGCIAIEDTPAGLASASGAGLKVIAVTNSYPAERLGNAFKVVSSLSGIDLDGLKLLV